MNNIYVICDARLVEPYVHAISNIYSLGIVKGWRVLRASTHSDYARIAIPLDLYREYFSVKPIKGKMLETIPGMGKIMDHLIVVELTDLQA